MQLFRTNYSSNGISSSKPVMVILSDGGPDHRVTFGSVKMSMIALFFTLGSGCLGMHADVPLSKLDQPC